jgi:site-specific recombinase XerD
MAGRPKGTGGLAKEFSGQEIQRIDKCLVGTLFEHRNRALFYLGLGTGMRIAEICGLCVRDVAPFGKVVRQIVLERHSTKSRKSRTVYVSRQAVTHLRTYLDERELLENKDGPLFPSRSRRGQSISANSATQTLSDVFKRAGVEHVSSHSLRRTHANTLRRNGTDLKIIQEQLGHASLATTERYFLVDPLEMSRAVDKLWF